MTKEASPTTGERLTEEGLIDVPGFWSRWVRLPNGARAHYMTSGTSGPAIFLLHSLLDGSSGAADWHLTAPFLGANGFRVYCPDLPAFGLSDTRREYLDQKPKTHVDFVIDLADALCIDQFYLAGVGGGSMDTVKIAISNPDRLLGVVFISGAFGPQVDYSTRVLQGDGSFWPEASGYVSPPFDGTEATMRAILDGLLRNADAVIPGVVAMATLTANRQREARVGVPPSPQDFNAHDIVWQTKDRINVLQLPMLCLYGLGSTWLPVENGFAQEGFLPNIQFFYPDDCGHHVPLDRPDLFNQLMLEFCRNGKVGWQTALVAGVSQRRPVLPAVVETPPDGFPAPRPEAYGSLAELRAALGGAV